jgi:hypothetical protein
MLSLIIHTTGNKAIRVVVQELIGFMLDSEGYMAWSAAMWLRGGGGGCKSLDQQALVEGIMTN